MPLEYLSKLKSGIFNSISDRFLAVTWETAKSKKPTPICRPGYLIERLKFPPFQLLRFGL
jgi:hypothetical protein